MFSMAFMVEAFRLPLLESRRFPCSSTPRSRPRHFVGPYSPRHLNGAADSGKSTHIDTNVVLKHVSDGDCSSFFAPSLDGRRICLGKLADVHRHSVLQHWRTMATGYETYQFHVRRSGLALLVAYLLHLIQNRHVQIPK